MDIINVFLKTLCIKHSKAYLRELFNTHPYKYNMYGMQLVLSHYGVKTIGVRFENKEEAELTVPCVLHLSNDFVVCKDVIADDILYIRNNTEERRPVKEFCKQWTGHALLVENAELANETELRKHLLTDILGYSSQILLLLIPFILLSITMINIWEQLNLPTFVCLALDAVGYALCVILMQKQLFGSSIVGDKVCSLFHQKDCNDVLHSKASKLFETYSWSEVGLSYFSARILLFILLKEYAVSLWLVDACAMSYGLWSVWYQRRVAKQWCLLCLFVQLVIWTEGLYSMMTSMESVSIYPLSLFSLLFVAVLFCVHFLSISKTEKKASEQTAWKFKKMKSDEKVFNALLQAGTYYSCTNEDSHICFGNSEGRIIVTVLTNPHCNPCALMHKRLERLLKINPQIKIQYIFSSFSEELEASSKYLIAVYQQSEYAVAMKIYDEWYESGKYNTEKFFSKYEMNVSDAEVEKEHARHKAWKERCGFNATPTILVNGYLFPEEYTIEDLEFI